MLELFPKGGEELSQACFLEVRVRSGVFLEVRVFHFLVFIIFLTVCFTVAVRACFKSAERV